MVINNKSGLTIMIGPKKKRIMTRAFDALTTGAVNQYTYYIEQLNINVKNYVYYLIRNNLSVVEDDVKAKKVTTPVVIFITEFDYMQDVSELDKIKKLLYDFIERMPVPVHIYVAGDTYELCRNEEVLVAHTGKLLRFADYEEYRNFMLHIEDVK